MVKQHLQHLNAMISLQLFLNELEVVCSLRCIIVEWLLQKISLQYEND